MSELTKEYFERHINDVASGLEKRLGNKFLHLEQTMVKREEFVEKTKELAGQIDELAGMTARGFMDLQSRLDMREEVESLTEDMSKIKTALNMS